MRKLRPRARLRIHATRTRGKRSFLRSFFLRRSFVLQPTAPRCTSLHFISTAATRIPTTTRWTTTTATTTSSAKHEATPDTVQRAAQLSHSKSWQQLSRGASSRRRRRQQLLGRARRLTTALRATQQSKTKQNKQQEAKNEASASSGAWHGGLHCVASFRVVCFASKLFSFTKKCHSVAR